MSARGLERTRSEEIGAVAVMVAVLALVLIVVAALSVDLGKAWARGRAVQKQADVSAIAAGSLLPMSTTDTRADNEPEDIAAKAADFLNQNKATGQGDADASLFFDNDLTNGELDFQNASGADCANNCVRMVLTPPQAEVDFQLGALVSPGVDVLRSATVEVFSELPPKDKVIPLWLPAGCNYGPIEGDTEGGVTPGPTPTSTSATPSPTATASPTGTASPSATASSTPTPGVVISPRGTHTLTGTSPVVAAAGSTRNILNYSITGLPNNVDRASVRLVAPDGSYFIEYAVASAVPHGTMVVPPFEIGTEVTNTPGDWTSYAVVQEKGNNKPLQYSANNLVVSVSGTPPPSPTSPAPTTSPSVSPSVTDVPVGCAGQSRGNFGQLYSPRSDTDPTNKAQVLSRNLALGLDHLPVPFDTTTYTVEKECAKSNGSNKIDGAQLDDVSRDGNNCIIGDTGNDGPRLFDGLIGGVDGQPGRLDVAKGVTNPMCGRSDTVVGSTTINNDVLSCYLRGGATLGDIAMETGVDDSMLDPSVKQSPRFVYIPMVQATDRAQKGYQPLIDYVPAFITDETQTSPVTADNGLQVAGNSIKVIRLFAFNKAALPINEQSPNGMYNTALERPIVRLVG